MRAQWKRWVANAVEDPDLCAELKSLEAVPEDSADFREGFGSDLSFGTGGLRGKLGAGPGRMNIYTVRRATQGLADYLMESALERKVAIAYDSRIKSDRFAMEAACVLAANGIDVALYPRLMPTPALSFAVRELRCGAGICITASHNPAEYNGYKVYGADGCQITLEAAKRIEECIRRIDVLDGPRRISLEKALASGVIRYIEEAVVEHYLDAVGAQEISDWSDLPLHVVYTPLNGAGLECVTKVLRDRGVDVTVVPEQEQPDGRFPTCPYPNPEEPTAMELGRKLCSTVRPGLLLATDPDCDRVGVAAPYGEDYRLLTGNEIGVLLLEYICSQRVATGTMPDNPVVIKTIVTTDMARPIAARYGVELWEVLTGFKFIGERIGWLEAQEQSDRFLLGFEESCGYLVGRHVRDKDGVVASLLICEMARYHRKRGKTLHQAMEELYGYYGYYQNRLLSFELDPSSGQELVRSLMERLRTSPPNVVGGMRLLKVQDYRISQRIDASGWELPSADVLGLRLEHGCKVIVRPSGTEPKVKAYVFSTGKNRWQSDCRIADLSEDIFAIVNGMAQSGSPA